MAFKDTINKMISYFDTDEVSEVEEETPIQKAEAAPKQQPQQKVRQSHTQQVPQQRPLSQTKTQTRDNHLPNYQNQSRPTSGDTYERRASQQEAHLASNFSKGQNLQETNLREQTTIALKFPKKYEDAQEIVDLLIENECVLIDFQYMLDAQARRCLDFIDGASKVLYGTLQKVGSSMYLLTPSNVSVNIEDMNIPNSNQDFGYDFDMKRR
ncbi:cell division protein SepF [Streptococcus didelphis]|uniref:Cell division protein SepF n=1 Tax=Streptococcus didelphis TaxID=102886 RepID=A0ABY9LGS0_9STRE|nr:cell division protein SepF [Streptococcus didelphis]WMB28057.1 cell division protein SepF [Streptococcus didelphis]WMB29970.1 cell division protein SepF [Streptococcus didelphis]